MSSPRRRRLPEFPQPLCVEALADNGDGIARCGERELRVAGALPGEKVTVTALRRRKGFVQCLCAGLEECVDDRVQPFCPHALICGGCTLQHLDHAAQMRHKTDCMAQALHRFGVAPRRWLAPVVGPLQGYRRKARLGVRLVPKKGGVLVGFRESGSSLVTPTQVCAVLAPAFGERLADMRALVSRLSCPGKIPQIEVAAGDTAAAIVLRHLEPLSAADLAELEAFSERTALHVYLQSGGPNRVRKLAPRDGCERLEYRLSSGIVLEFHPLDFVQINACVNDEMVTLALALLELEAGERAVDLFCGIGNFTLPMAARGAHVIGIEGDPDLVARACENRERNALGGVQFTVADLYGEALPACLDEHRCQKLLLDPPRSGALEMLSRLTLGGLERVVYVSCNRDTFARDARLLVDRGFELEAIGLLDMFPHTGHTESIALFQR